MNITNNAFIPGLNTGNARVIHTAPRTTTGESFEALLNASGRTAARSQGQDIYTCKEGDGADHAVSVQEAICLKRDDSEIQAVLDKMVDGEVPLTPEQLAFLTEKYDAVNMSGEEYEAFAEDLKEMGILGRTEREAVHGENPRWGRLYDYHGSDHYPRVVNDEKKLGFGDDFSEGWGGNALAWTKYHSGERSWYDDIGGYDMNWSSAVFTLVHSVLEQMDSAARMDERSPLVR